MENSQKIRKKYENPLRVAIVYYDILSVVNNLRLTKKHVQFLGWLSVKKEYDKQDFIRLFDSSEATVISILKQLRGNGLLTKDKIPTIHPALAKLDFNQPLTLNITIENEAS